MTLAQERQDGIEQEGGDEVAHVRHALHEAVVCVLQLKIGAQESDQRHIKLPVEGHAEIGEAEGGGGKSDSLKESAVPAGEERQGASRKQKREDKQQQRPRSPDAEERFVDVRIVAVAHAEEDEDPDCACGQDALCHFRNEHAVHSILHLEDRADDAGKQGEEGDESGDGHADGQQRPTPHRHEPDDDNGRTEREEKNDRTQDEQRSEHFFSSVSGPAHFAHGHGIEAEVREDAEQLEESVGGVVVAGQLFA